MYRQSAAQTTPGKNDRKSVQKSIYTGWTGMQSKHKLASVIGNEGSNQRSGNVPGKEKDVPMIEIDSTFGKLLSLPDGQKVCAMRSFRGQRLTDRLQ